jgi:hypothetical protein
MVGTCFDASSTHGIKKIIKNYKKNQISIFGGISKFLKLIIFGQILAILGKFG